MGRRALGRVSGGGQSVCPTPTTVVRLLLCWGHWHFLSTATFRTILEPQLDADSGTLCGITSLDTPALDFRDFVQYDGSQELVTRSRFLRLTDVLVFDKRTRMLFFEFSEFCLALVCIHDMGMT